MPVGCRLRAADGPDAIRRWRDGFSCFTRRLGGRMAKREGRAFLSGCGRRARSAGSDGAFRPELVSAGRCSDLAHSRYPGRSAVGGKIGRDARRSLPPGTARAGRDRPDLAQKPGRGGPSERHGNLSGAYGSASLGGGRSPAVFTRFGRARGFVSGRGVRSGRVALPRVLFGQRYGGGPKKRCCARPFPTKPRVCSPRRRR